MAEEERPQETITEREERQRKVASWKFDLLETVSADPLCKPADHKVIAAYVRYLGKAGAQTYRSNIQLSAATNLSEPTISASRKRLVKLGYLEADGYTSMGVPIFKVNNPRNNIVLDHIEAAKATLQRLAAEKKERERQKKIDPSPKDSLAPNFNVPQNSLATRPKLFRPNTYSEYVEGFSYEGDETLNSITGGLPGELTGDGDFLFAPPPNKDTCDQLLAEILEGVCLSPAVENYFRIQLMAGKLRRSMVDQQLEEAAA